MAKKEETVKVEKKQLSAIDCVLDPNNTDNIFLMDDEGETIEFEQIALVPYQDNIYVLLKPIQHVEGVGENDAMIFRVDADEEDLEFYLEPEDDDDILDEVFNEYKKLFDADEETKTK